MAYLTPAQQDILRKRAPEIRTPAEFGKEIERRLGVSRDFRALVEETGIREGRELARPDLARMVELVWKIQNLQAMTLPQLLGTYAYHQHFKKFEGDEVAFSAHMAATHPRWKKGSVGYPGVDVSAFGKALAAAIGASRSELGIAAHRILGFKGAGRGLVSGFLNLWDPERSALVNGAVISVFKGKGPFVLPKPMLRRLESDAATDFRIPPKAGATKRLLSWQLLFEEVREALELPNFLDLDWFLFHLTGKIPRVSGTGVRGSAGLGAGTGDQSANDFIESFLASVTDEQIETRNSAIAEAKALVDAHVGALTADHVTELLRLWSTDEVNGEIHYNRFSPAFVGHNRNQIVSKLDLVNEWIERLWHAPENQIAEVLDQYWEASEIPGAGLSLPTTLLHTRDPERWFPYTFALRRGYVALTGDEIPQGRHLSHYLRYSRGLRDLVETHQIPPSVVDLLLSQVRSESDGIGSGDGTGPGPDKSRQFEGFVEDTFQFLRDLEANNSDAWYGKNQRERFRNAVRSPLRSLITDLGSTFIENVAPYLEHEPKSPNTLSKIRKNVWGKQAEGAYWTHFWAAFHRPELSKNEDFQLYVYLAPEICTYGMYTGSASEADLGRFRKRLIARSEEVEALLRTLTELRVVIRRTPDHAEAVSSEQGNPTTAEELATLLEESAVLRKELRPEEAVDQGSALVDDVTRVFTTLYPLYALATLDDPGEAIFDPDRAIDDEAEADYTREDFLQETLLDEAELDTILSLLDDKPQLILYGPPGTGKTWLAERLGRLLGGDGDACRIVQFHPSYGYEDFVEGIRPSVDTTTGQIRYDVVPGIFRKFCDQARKQPKQKFVLVIDEINRGNLPRIFGELLYLLERRGKRIELAVSGDGFSVPKNLLVIGTMNTADQSIALVDTALRRRFHFKELTPDPVLLERWLGLHVPDHSWVAELLTRLNDELLKLGVDANLAIGHSHFMDPALTETRLERIWGHSIVPTLQEYFYGQPQKVDALRYEEFVSGFTSSVAPEEDDGSEDLATGEDAEHEEVDL